MLKVGELAALANLTVRTLHHYDSIGLLRPSARSDAGYRLYDRDDVARLHRIQALRAFGLSLADIALTLDSPAGSPLAIVDRQLEALEVRMAEARRLRDQLLRVRAQLVQGSAPDLSTWLTTLENTMDMINVYERYFTKEELERLPMVRSDAAQAQWQAMVEQVRGLIESQVPPNSDAAKAFALRWLQTFERDTGGDAALQAKLNAMVEREKDAVGMPAQIFDYVKAAVGELKSDTWAKYLRPEVLDRMRRHVATRGQEWTPLIAQVQAEIKADPEATGPRARDLGRQWMALFHDMVGTDPQDVDAFRKATATEPLLRMGPGIGDATLAWLRKALTA
ncbi:MerR family transcriptional regulator [Telluria mixta]|uniref:MerR family transcriptional regulator n=1 Tax=Telluria mixta TaxID=34071 RepID=A0ABT2BZ35_9BURK|nr:MerR family transcriptional regulator [Telluria mixta]MCS0629644.1 MerR family transcriptional regulator [Telluria mixta]WEM96788.1 MerR family transcriptional regulator [Telluria mixta]